MPKQAKQVTFYLRLHNGNGCRLSLSNTFTLQRTLSILLDQKLDLPSSYRLIVNGKHVRDYTRTIAELGIVDDSIVHVEEASPRPKKIYKIDVSIFFEGEKIIVQAKGSDLILNLKQRISELYKIDPQEQLLVFKGHKLKNDRTLQHYRIQPDSLICLQVIPQKSPQINLKLVSKQEMLLESVQSLTHKKSYSSHTTLFRSDSIGERKYKDSGSFDVEFKQKREDEDIEGNDKSSIIGMENEVEMKKSITFNNLFGSQFNPYECAEVHSEQLDDQSNSTPFAPITNLSQFQQI